MNPHTLFRLAQRYIPSGVNSPVRAFRAVGGDPLFVKKGKGAFIWDEEDKKYLDFCCSWGALLFGHAPDELLKTLSREMQNGTSFGIATRKEVELAVQINALYPSMEKTRLVSSGTEAGMAVVRLARGFTGRKKILKIEGGYHGQADSLLVKAGSGGATFGVPDSAGVPQDIADLTISIPFNDLNALEEAFQKNPDDIAAFILEPVPANMGVVIPEKNYLEAARRITTENGALLIFDEVITGFRISEGGAQKIYGIKPDLTCLGKILGGGFPLAAFGGKAEIMDRLAPGGPVYQAGTLSGNPVAVSAALWVLSQFRVPSSEFRGKKKMSSLHKSFDSFLQLNKLSAEFCTELEAFIKKKSLPLQLNGIGSLFTLFFTEDPVMDYASAKKSDTKKFAKFFHACLKKGIYLAPSQFEANFISTQHTSKDLDFALSVFKKALS
jgi:glutamate-1-semialdehyde 2,1-aminomutase